MPAPSSLRTRLAACLLTTLWLAACGGGSSNDPSLPSTPSSTSSGVTLGTGGGNVATADGKLTVDVAAGALSGDTRFTITAVDGIDGLPGDYVLVPGTAYQVDWSGAGFSANNQVTLRIADPSATASAMPGLPGIVRAIALSVQPQADPPVPSSAVVRCPDGSTHIVAIDPGDPGYDNVVVLLCPGTTQGGTGGGTSTSQVGVVKPAPGRYPSISASPQDVSVAVGGSVTFSVTATAVSGVSYQWRRNGVDIAGATAMNYYFIATAADDGAGYSVLVSNAYGHVLSAAATLTVTDAPPVIAQPPQAASTPVGGTASFSVTANGAAPLSYQWSLGGVPLSDRAAGSSVSGISGSQTATLTLSNVQATDAGSYSVVISNGRLPDASGGADLTVTQAAPSTWTRLQGSTGNDLSTGVALDPSSGKVYLSGTTFGSLDGQTGSGNTSHPDVFVTQYDATGLKQWTRQFAASLQWVPVQSVAVDASGNVYVVGSTAQGLDGVATAGHSDVFIVKFDSTGHRLWTRQFGGANDDVAEGVATDGAGNVYVVGYTGPAGFGGQAGAAGGSAFLAQYHTDGTQGWLNLWGGTGATQAYGVAVDTLGHVHVVGAATGNVDGQPRPAGASSGDYDVFVTSFDAASGTKRWTHAWGSINQNDFGRSIATDTAGNIYVTGSTNGIMYGTTSRPPSPFLAKLDPSGVVQWGVQWTVGDLYDSPAQLALDASGNAYVAGTAYSSGSVGLFVSKFDTTGAAQGVYLHGGGTPGVQVEGTALAIGSNGQGDVCGNVHGGPFDGSSNAGAEDAYLHSFVLP